MEIMEIVKNLKTIKEKWLKNLVTFDLQKTGLEGHKQCVFKYLKNCHIEKR